ncbi:MAG: hypothetical protein IPG96_06120 [Proteobacteria bacterium]|nr:hypothetical protein [Pseudomonadota bacterium]
MADDKLKLPTGITTVPASTGDIQVSDRVRSEMLKTQRAGIEGAAKVEVARLQVAQEAIAATRALFEVFKSHNELQATRAEWEGRVSAAEAAVRKAAVDLETAQEQNKPRLEELDQSREVQQRLLALFDEVMKQATHADLSEETKKEARQYLLQLSDRIVQLRK